MEIRAAKHIIEKGPPKDHLSQVLLNLVKWRFIKYDGQTENRRQVTTKAHLLSGEER